MVEGYAIGVSVLGGELAWVQGERETNCSFFCPL